MANLGDRLKSGLGCPVGDFFDGVAKPISSDEADERSRPILDEARTIAADHDREIETETEIGTPDRAIVG